jgi:hypothetical protein
MVGRRCVKLLALEQVFRPVDGQRQRATPARRCLLAGGTLSLRNLASASRRDPAPTCLDRSSPEPGNGSRQWSQNPCLLRPEFWRFCPRTCSPRFRRFYTPQNGPPGLQRTWSGRGSSGIVPHVHHWPLALAGLCNVIVAVLHCLRASCRSTLTKVSA